MEHASWVGPLVIVASTAALICIFKLAVEAWDPIDNRPAKDAGESEAMPVEIEGGRL